MVQERARRLVAESWYAGGCAPLVLPEGFWLKSKQPSWGERAGRREEPRATGRQVVQEHRHRGRVKNQDFTCPLTAN